MKRLHSCCLGLAAATALGLSSPPLRAEHAGETSEHDFIGELPVVLSASRLSQPLADAPGAVTVIDRELIKASGAREIVDLFRLVPGFQVSYANGANPVVTYHGLSDEYSRRMQVLVDGRSAYSPFYLGEVAWNTLPIALDDIERIEILRGSNSATYGANAFLGVVNIITRHPSQSPGVFLSASLGDQGIRDNVFRFGGSHGALNYRFTTGRRVDSGFNKVNDTKHASFLAFRGDLRLNARDELQFQFGANENSAGAGLAGSSGNPMRTQYASGNFAQVVWRRSFGPDEELAVNAYHMREEGKENFTATAGPLFALVDAGRRTERTHLELQHIFRPNPSTRVVWGMESRREMVASRQMFDTSDPQRASLYRLFGNLEWRLAPQWLVNAGALLEKYSLTGTDLAPRLMVNYQPSPEHTLRAGTSTAYRNPSLAEQRADIKYYVANFPLVITTYKSLGGLQPEKVFAREVSYLGEFRNIGLTLDARGFSEHVSQIIDVTGTPANFVNRHSAIVRGFEYQMRWNPSRDTLLLLSQAFVRIASDNQRLETSAPGRSTTLFLSQKLLGGWQLGMTHHWIGPMEWLGFSDPLPRHRRLDLRLGYPFRSGPFKGEMAVVTQNVFAPYSEYRTDYRFTRRSFATLSLEF